MIRASEKYDSTKKQRDGRLAAIALLLALSLPLYAQAPCATPSAPTIVFVPPGGVAVGQTYAVVWNEVANLDPDGVYLIERTSDANFSSILDAQQTSSTSASFISTGEGTLYHRVRALSGCDPAKVSANSAVRSVSVVAGKPNVVFTVQPKSAILNVGDSLASQSTSFVVENIGKASVNVALPSGPIGGSPNFFTISDPEGELQSGSITLAPRTPRKLDIRFTSVSTATAASFQGFIFVVTQPDPAVVTPYAFVNLKIGAADTAKPELRFKGVLTEYAFFPGYSTSQPDSARPPITIQIRNPGTTPMHLGAEIGPEVWLIPNSNWNAAPIPPSQSIDVELRVDRTKALAGSAFPRYTYFTVRSKNGQSARMLVQDNDAPAQSTGRAQLAEGIRSYTVPQVVSIDSPNGRQASRLRLSNVGGAALDAEIFFTPRGIDGGDPSRVKRAVVTVPPNDVVTLTDPLFEIFDLPSPAVGQMEIRTSADKVNMLTVNSSVYLPLASGEFAYRVPVAVRGEGSRVGSLHTIAGFSASPSIRPALVLTETTGDDGAQAVLTFFDQVGRQTDSTSVSVPRNGYVQIDDVAASGRIDLNVIGGRGAVVGMLILLDTRQNSAATIVSQPVNQSVSPRLSGKWGADAAAGATRVFIVPGVTNGNPGNLGNVSYATILTLIASQGLPASFKLTFVDSFSGVNRVQPVINVPAGNTIEISNVLENVFGIATGSRAFGMLQIEATDALSIIARLLSVSGPSTSIAGALPVISNFSEAITAATSGLQRPVYFDGLEQSIDGKGRSWDVLLSELAGKEATVTVRLYEAGNRTSSIADKPISVGPRQQVRLAPIFKAMDLDADNRRKDRTNVQVLVYPTSGSGSIVAVATGTDVVTGDVLSFLLTPSGGVLASGGGKVTAVPPPARRRGVRH
jgi:hypothetical protein